MTDPGGGGRDDGYLPGPRPGCYPPPARGPVVPGPPGEAGPGRPAGRAGAWRGLRAARAGRRLRAPVSAGRRARQQRTLLAVLGALSAVVLLLSGGAWALTSYVSGAIGRVSAGTTGTPSSGPLNILVAGVDVRAGLTRRQQILLHVGHDISANSDTLMLAHIPASHRYVKIISLPRDSWVRIPGHGMNKINAAFGLGGPRLMVATVERATGLRINDYVEVNFLGFVKVIDALGGVDICLPYAVNDHYSGLRLSAGPHRVDGVTALKFARDRHSFAGSDLARIGDQQQLLASLLSEAVSSGTLANPVRLARFLAAVSSAVKVDQGFNLTELADQLRSIRPGDVTFRTVPLANVNYITSTGQSAVLWNKPAAGALFAALRHDHAVARHARRRHRGLTRRQVSVDVYNGTMIGGLSASTGAELARLGFRVHGSGLTWPRQDVSQTLIEYPAGQRAAARLVHKVLAGATARLVARLARIRIVLGVTGYGISAPPSVRRQPGRTRGNGGSPGIAGQRTAAQAACR